MKQQKLLRKQLQGTVPATQKKPPPPPARKKSVKASCKKLDFDKRLGGGAIPGTSKPTGRSMFKCPACDEPYEDPTTEEWICCGECGKWWHEKCTDYDVGEFTCDLC